LSIGVVFVTVKSKDRAYQRVGKTNQRISASKIRELAQQQRKKLHWDERICERATLEDILSQEASVFIGEVNRQSSMVNLQLIHLLFFNVPLYETEYLKEIAKKL